MAAFPIAYDLIRLFLGPLASTPRGIDRVDLGYARFFAENWRGDFGGTLPTAWGFRWYERDRVLKLINRLEEHWLEVTFSHEDPVLDHVKQRLAGKPTMKRGGRLSTKPEGVYLRRAAEVLQVSGLSLGLHLVRSAPRNCLYVNIGQIGLAMHWLLAWLQQRPDIKPVFMLHDVIPLENPEFVSVRAHHYHGRMVDNVAHFAAGLITTTPSARDSVLNELHRRGRPAIRVATTPLPVAPVFLHQEPPDEELAEHDYFVACGTIEPRKNHGLLLNVWRSLVREHGSRAPKLVIVGSPGWGAEPILHMLRQCKATSRHVILALSLSSPALRRLVAHAKALLMPSFAEGFGLPIIEALTLGTPVIASDLPAHRDIAGDFAIYRDPIDGPGWAEEICRLAFGGEEILKARKRIKDYRPLTATEYFTRIGDFLADIA
jgi:glycosyltransferase involved in cell wall biosynthesis